MSTIEQAPVEQQYVGYIPKGAATLRDAKPAQIRLGIQGFAGTGKTWSATTFPNPIFLSLDRGLGAHNGSSRIVEVPFYDLNFINDVSKKVGTCYEWRKNAILTWLQDEAPKLTGDQTLVIDAITGLQNAHSYFTANTKFYNAQGKEDSYKAWNDKLDWMRNVLEATKFLKCHVITLAHEVEKKDALKDGGGYSGKIKPLITGTSSDELITYHTDWFRAITSIKKKSTEINESGLAQWGCKTYDEYVKLTNVFPGDIIYLWQTIGDDNFDAKASSLVSFPRLIPATYEHFSRYMRKVA